MEKVLIIAYVNSWGKLDIQIPPFDEGSLKRKLNSVKL